MTSTLKSQKEGGKKVETRSGEGVTVADGRASMIVKLELMTFTCKSQDRFRGPNRWS